MNRELAHESVLLDEAIEALRCEEGKVFLDATFGRGGHSWGVLSRMSSGVLIATDRDHEAELAASRLREEVRLSNGNQFLFYRMAMSQIDTLGQKLSQSGVAAGRFDGVLMDIGVSSPQLDDAARGFSFSKDGPLDMRMDQSSGETAAALLARVDEQALADIFYQYGEEKKSRRIARVIIEARAEAAIESTKQLADLIVSAVGWRRGEIHPATRCFQALRICVNQELDELQKALTGAVSILRPGGRLVVISFHSLEDRIVKRFMKPKVEEMVPGIPLLNRVERQQIKQIGKAIKPSQEEINVNPRARSAVMRVGEVL